MNTDMISGDDLIKYEQFLTYGLLADAQRLADGRMYEAGKVPMTLVFRPFDMKIAPVMVNVDWVKEKCGNDLNRAMDVCRNFCVASDIAAQMLVFETELKSEQLPEYDKGLRPEVVFAVGRTLNSPRERSFVIVRSASTGEIQTALAPNWERFARRDDMSFGYVLPADVPTPHEREVARDSLARIGFEITMRGNGEAQRQEQETQKRSRGFCQGR